MFQPIESTLDRHYLELDKNIAAFQASQVTSEHRAIQSPEDIELWCMETRHEWAALFNRWLLAICFGREAPENQVRKFVKSVGEEHDANSASYQAGIVASRLPEEDSKVPSRTTMYLKSILRRRDLAECLLEDVESPSCGIENVLSQLAEEIRELEGAGSLVLKLREYSPPNSAGVCVQCALIWLAHDLAIWLLELHNEAGPWVRSTTYHLDTIDRLRGMLRAFWRHANNLLPAAAEKKRLIRLYVEYYIRDELDYLGGSFRRPLEALMSGPDKRVTQSMEERAERVIGRYKGIVKDKLYAAITMFNDLSEELQDGAPDIRARTANHGVFVPRIQWVYIVCNKTEESHSLLYDDEDLLTEFQAETESSFEEAIQPDPHDCRALQKEYAVLIDSFFEGRADELEPGAADTISDEQGFLEEVIIDFAHHLGVGIGNSKAIFQSLYEELMLSLSAKPIERHWGNLSVKEYCLVVRRVG